MRLSHINITIPENGEAIARSFYGTLLGMQEIPKPVPLRARGGVWFDAGGCELHLSVERQRDGVDTQRHFGLECTDVDGLRNRLAAAGVSVDNGRTVPWKRFFVHDPFGNRLEIHEPGAMRA